MKKTLFIIPIAVVLVGVSGFWYFNQSNKPAPSTPAGNPSYELNTVKNELKYYSDSATYPIIKGLADKNIETRVNELIIKKYVVTTTPPEQDLGWLELTPECKQEPIEFSCKTTNEQTTAVSELTPKYLSLYASGFVYFARAAHPTHGGFSLNYDLERGREIELKDLFKTDSKYITIISDFIRNDIKKKYETVDEGMLSEGTQPENIAKQSFVMTEKGLLFMFGDYEVGPYVMGESRSLVPYSEIQNMLTDEFKQQIPSFKPSPLLNE